jgi:hypothetical protein
MAIKQLSLTLVNTAPPLFSLEFLLTDYSHVCLGNKSLVSRLA